MITADTITDEQIRELRRRVRFADAAEARDLCQFAGVEWLDDIELACDLALSDRRYAYAVKSRARCAEILNARAEVK